MNTENPPVLLKAYVPLQSSPCYETRNGLTQSGIFLQWNRYC